MSGYEGRLLETGRCRPPCRHILCIQIN